MKCLGILWNTVHPMKEEVLKDICILGDLIEYHDLNLEKDYERFVREIYEQDQIATWKVDKKLETMFASTDARKVCVFIVDISTDEIYFHPYKKTNVFKNIEEMKVSIREKYKNKVNVYFFDNIMHLTDDENEYERDLEVVQKFMNIVGLNPIQNQENSLFEDSVQQEEIVLKKTLGKILPNES